MSLSIAKEAMAAIISLLHTFTSTLRLHGTLRISIVLLASRDLRQHRKLQYHTVCLLPLILGYVCSLSLAWFIKLFINVQTSNLLRNS